MMVSTDEEHHFANSGTTLPDYWREAERCIKKAADAGIKMNGTVSTIWGSPISGPTKLQAMPNTDLHVAHFHVTRGWGPANVLAALNAGIDIFEGTIGGLGGQPSNFVGDCPVPGTGSYYYRDPNYVGLTTMEDMVVMMDEMGIDTGINVERLLEIGRLMEKTIGRKLRSEAILNGRIPKEPRPEYKRKGLEGLKAKFGESRGQKFPE
jgi:hydroxymethylglutaryl-CoA lyase